MRRSNQPPLWALFGAGGMLSALVGWMLVFLTGLAAPLGILPGDHLDYASALAFARSPAGKAFLFLAVALFLWHGAHRIFHSVHDLGLRASLPAQLACYGVALAGTLSAAVRLFMIGF
ncbi:MAG TPA: fumarate reductase subunit FrdD [Myxococcota bacterium]|nr:fumarate reductase subunit FrdD [Myxococcota bacterium]